MLWNKLLFYWLREKEVRDQSFVSSLRKAGYEVTVVEAGSETMAPLAVNKPDIVICDALLMHPTDVSVCRRWRQVYRDVPMICIGAVGVLDEGMIEANVFLERPFTPRKLLNRVRFLLPSDNSGEVVYFGDVVFYLSKRSVNARGEGERPLTPKLARLLEEFVRHPNMVISRLQIMQNVWQTDYIGDTRTLDVHIRWIRECIEENPSKPKLLQTVRGQGYILRIDDEE